MLCATAVPERSSRRDKTTGLSRLVDKLQVMPAPSTALSCSPWRCWSLAARSCDGTQSRQRPGKASASPAAPLPITLRLSPGLGASAGGFAGAV